MINGSKRSKLQDPLVDKASHAGIRRLGLALSATALSLAVSAMPVQAGWFSKHKIQSSSYDTLRMDSASYYLTDSADGKRYVSNGREKLMDGSTWKWPIDRNVIAVPFQNLHDTDLNMAIAVMDMREYVPTRKYVDVADYQDITHYLEKYYPPGHNGLKIIYFWATFCHVCVGSVPHLPEYQRTLNAFKDSCERKFNMKLPEIYICPLSTDALGIKADGIDAARKFVGEHLRRYQLPYLVAGAWTAAFDATLYPEKGDRPLPSFLLVDENNVIRKVQHPDYDNYKTWPEFISTEILYPYFEYLHKNADKANK